MSDFLKQFFSASGFMPHGHCYLWRPGVVWLHVVSDALIALAYVTIPFTLLEFIRRRRDLPFSWMFVCFGVFIVACGGTHVMEIVTLWSPLYWMSGALKAITAVASVTTAVLLARLLPTAVSLPSPAELRRLNAELQQSQELYRTIARNFPGGAVVLYDRELRYLLAEGEGLKLSGLSREGLEGKTIDETQLPEDARKLEGPYRAALAGEPQAFEVELANKRVYWIQVVPIRNERGEVTSGMAVSQDITERKRTEDAIRKSEENLETTLNSIGDAVIATNEQGYVVRMNPIAEKLTGWPRTDAVGKELAIVLHVVHEETRMPVASPVEPVLRDGRVAAMAHHPLLIARGGTERPIAESAAPILDREGKIKGAVLVFRDISEERRAQESAKALHGRLALADRMASVGTLASGVAHEINNPLAYVISNLSLLAEELPKLASELPPGRTGDLEQMLSDSREGAERVRLIVRDLRTFSRAEEDTRGAVHLERVLERSITMTANEIRHRAQLVKIYGDVPPVEANESRLGQVFVNLLVNAAHAIKEGDASKHEIRVSTRMDASRRVAVEIRDTGAGISPENLKRIFDPFFTTKQIGEGTGLGLAICHGIVASIGGEIEVESEPGKGTVFRVLLLPATSEVTPARPMMLPTTGGRRGRVLVVDDEETVANVIRRVLTSEHDVVLAASGAEALEALAGPEAFDVILCDLMMPEMSGMDLHAELLRTAPATAERMIFLTGGAFTAHAREFLDRIPNPRFEKPFDMQSLRTTVRERVR